MNSLKLKGGTLCERLDRFEEERTGGGDNLSCWALASKDQINLMTHHIYGWYSVDAMRESVARKILQGDAQEMSERLQGLWWDLETNPVLRHEFLEQRKVRAEHEFSAQRKVRATLAVPDLERQATLAEYASYVRTPMGKGFSGGPLELMALGEISGQNVYLWTRQQTGWSGYLATRTRTKRSKPSTEDIHLALYDNHFNRLIWRENDVDARAQPTFAAHRRPGGRASATGAAATTATAAAAAAAAAAALSPNDFSDRVRSCQSKYRSAPAPTGLS